MSSTTRRELLSHGVTGLLVVLTGSACNSKSRPITCTDVSALAPADLAVRTSLKYVDTATEQAKDCASCQQFVPSPSSAYGACGSCNLVKGPIHPKGSCSAFIAKS